MPASEKNRTTNRPEPATRKKRAPALPPEAFFGDGGGLLAATLAGAVEQFGALATDTAGQLRRYRAGVWMPDGEREVTDRVRKLLDEKFRPSHSSNVLVSLRARPPSITEENLNLDHLNLPNGLLNWRTGELCPHNPSIMVLARIPVEWDPEAECLTIDGWLGDVLPEDCRDLAYEIIGYALYNGNPLHKAVLLFGAGRNGKGTLIRLMTKLIGMDNASSVKPQRLGENRFVAAELYGKLVNMVGDIDPREFRYTAEFKEATGEDRMTVERKHGHPFQFTCRALMISSFNKLPRSRDTTEGFFSRWIVLPFGTKLAGREDPSIEDKMHDPAELQGLLVKAVEGLRRVMARGKFDLPPSVAEATKQFRMAADPYRRFASEVLQPDLSGFVPRSEVYSSWSAWAADNEYEVGSRQGFYSELVPAFLDVHGSAIGGVKRKGIEGFKGLAPLAVSIKSFTA